MFRVCEVQKPRALQGFGPLGGREFHLGDVKKRRFFSWFLVCRKEKTEKVVSEEFFNINGLTYPQHRPKIANISPTYAQHSLQDGSQANVGPTYANKGLT